MADVFKVIFELEANGQGVLKEIDAVAKKYGQVNTEIKKQEDELNKLLKQEQEILKLRAKSTSPSTAAQQTEALKKVQAQITGTKNELTKLAAAEKEVGNETKKLNETVKKGLDGTKELGIRAQLKKLKAELAATDDDARFLELSIQAGKLEDKLSDAAESARVFATDSGFEAVGNAIGNIGNKLLSLDFDGARQQSQLLVKASKQITFGEALKGIKDIGGTLLNLGKALLTNPFFLIGTAIALIIANFDKLKQSGGIIGEVFRGIGKAIQFATDLLFSLTDAVGLTTITFEKLNQSIIDGSKILLERQNKVFERQIAVAKAAGLETEKLEKKQQLEAIRTLGIQLSALEKRKKIKGILSEEEIKQEEEVANAILDAKNKVFEIDAASNKKRIDAAKKYAEDISKLFTDLEKRLADERRKNAEFNAANNFGAGSDEQIKAIYAIRQKLERENFKELEKNTLKEVKTKADAEKTKGLLSKIRAQQEKNFQNDLSLELLNSAKKSAIDEIELTKSKIETQTAIQDQTALQSAEKRLLIQQDYYTKLIAVEQKYIDERKKLGFDTTAEEEKLQQTKLNAAKATFDGQVEINKLTIDDALKTLGLQEDIAQSELKLKNARNSTLLKSELEYEKQRLEILKASGDEYADEVKRQQIKVNELSKEARKQEILEYTSYFEQISQAAISAANKIIDAKIKEVDKQTELQQKRVDEAKAVAESGNAELLEEEKKRLENLNKEKEKFVRQQQALATVELVANTAIAVSKAAAEGGVAAGITIAAALLALVAGLASARSIAGQAAYYDGGLFEEGFTGHGNPRDESGAVGRKPYIYHREEFIFNHNNTRKFRDIFEGVHEGRIDLREWQRKAKEYDSFNFGRSLNAMNPIINNRLEIDELRGQLDKLINVVQNQKTSVSLDEHGFSMHINKVIDRSNFIKNLAK